MTAKLVSHRLDRQNSYTAQFEPYNKLAFKTGLLPAASIICSEKNMIPVKCVNALDKNITIFKNQLLGFTKPITIGADIHSVHAISNNDYIESTNTRDNDHTNHNTSSSWTESRLFDSLSIDSLNISPVEKSRLKKMLWRNRDCFSADRFDLGKNNFYQAKIDLKHDYVAKWIPSRPVPYKLQGEMDAEIEGLKDAGIIEYCPHSKWNSQCFLVEKSTPGKYRFVVDMRAVNSQCLPDSYELSNVNHVLDKVGKCRYWSTLDFSQSFHQVEYHESSKPITAFMYKSQRYMFTRMVMGHCNSSSNFARMMDKLLLTVPIDTLVYFLDDLLLASSSIEEHLDKLEILLDKFRSVNMKLSASKCNLLKEEVNFIGITINSEGIRINKDRISSITKLSPPSNRKEVMSVLGVLQYNRKFIHNFATLAKPLYTLLKKENLNKFQWTNECQTSFDTLKHLIITSPCLSLPDVDDPHQSYVLSVDASAIGFGGVLTQLDDHGERKTIAYYSKSLPARKRKLSACKLEFLCMHGAIMHFAMYLRGTKFTVQTDCKALTSINTLFKDSGATLQRKFDDLAPFNFNITHIEGKLNVIPDFLSRYKMKSTSIEASCQTEDPNNQINQSHDNISSIVLTTNSTPKDVHENSNIHQPTHDIDITEVSHDTPQHLPHYQTFITFSDNDFPLIPYNFFSNSNPQLQSITTSASCTNNIAIARLPVCTCDIITPKKPHDEIYTISENTTGTNHTHIIPLVEIKQHQNSDIIIKEVAQWVSSGKRPLSIQQHQAPQELVTLWRSFNLLSVHKGVLYRKWIHSDKTYKQLIVVPLSLQEQILQSTHNSMESLHPGVSLTTSKCRDLYWWPKMQLDVELFVAACTKCHSIKQPKAYLKAPLKCLLYSHFNQAICIDHIVPSSIHMTSKGNRYILTIVDMWSGFIVALPTKTQSTAETVRLILHNWVFRFGLFKQIISDNAKGFSSNLYNAVFRAFNIKITRGTIYKSSSTAKVERSNKRINNALRAALPDNDLNNWDMYLGQVCLALNNLKSRHTQHSAYFLVFGRKAILPSHLIACNDHPEDITNLEGTDYNKHAYQHFRRMKNIIHRVRAHALVDYEYALSATNSQIKGPFFEPGDSCFILINCPVHKFGKRWHGPLVIKEKLNDHLYIINVKGIDKVINITKLKHYKPNKFTNKQCKEYTDKDMVTNNTDKTFNNQGIQGTTFHVSQDSVIKPPPLTKHTTDTHKTGAHGYRHSDNGNYPRTDDNYTSSDYFDIASGAGLNHTSDRDHPVSSDHSTTQTPKGTSHYHNSSTLDNTNLGQYDRPRRHTRHIDRWTYSPSHMGRH